MEKKLTSFDPIVDSKAELLVLGSMPGRVSLEKGQYYGHKNNHFWEIVFTAVKEDDPGDYRKRIAVLKKNKIGLWDVVRSCYRDGSRDDKISDPEINDIRKATKKCRALKAIFFNGRKAEKLFREHFTDWKIDVQYLPSTSPLNTLSVKKKTKIWRKAFEKRAPYH